MLDQVEAPDAGASPVDPSATPDTNVASAPDIPAPETSEPEPSSEPDIFNDTAKPGQDENFDQKSKKYYLEVAAGEMTLGNGGGPLGQESKADRAEKRNERFSDQMEMIERMIQQAEHARKWDGESHEYAGVKASGREFHEAREYLKSETGRKKVTEEMQRQGMSKDQAERAVKKTEELQDLIERQRMGEKLNEEEQRRMQELERDRDVRTGLQTTVTLAAKEGHEIKSEARFIEDRKKDSIGFSVEAPKVANLNSAPAVDPRADFPTAVNMKNAFSTAHSGLTLDKPANAPSVAAPVVVAAISKKEVSASGLDL